MTHKNRIQNDEARSLTDAFQELRHSQARTVELNPYAKKHKKAKKANHTVKIKCSKKEKDLSSKFEVKTLEKKSPFHKSKQKKNKLKQTIFSKKANDKKYTQTPSGRIRTKGVSVFTLSLSAFCFVVLFANYNFATNTSYIEPTVSTEEFEANQKAYNLEEIIQTNISVTKTKNRSTEERDIPFHTTYRENSFLPKGEQVITQPGSVGREKVTIVRTYENDQLIEEKCINSTMLQDPIEQIVDVGTSEFLAKYKVHIGDTMYLIKDSILKESANSSSKNIITIKKNLDVQLLELSGDWCKVSYNGTQGYIEASALTSATINPEMIEKNRIEKILSTVDPYMALNKPSGLTLDDFKRILSGNSQDRNKVFEQNAIYFYEAEQKYNINGVFLAAVGIHESQWGTSNIANDKKNLFGYGAYDSDAYGSSYTFATYQEGIDLVAKIFVKYYINPAGTPIYDGEIAQAKYYNGPTVSGINIRYASDPEWHTKVFSIMEDLYQKL